MENIQTRRALQSAFYLLFNDLRWYQRRGGKNQLRAVLSAWVRMMSPFTPHVCEELWAAGLGEGYASLADWPVADETLIDEKAEKAEDLLERTLNDVQEIVNVTKAKPGKITLYTTPAWKREMLRLAVEAAAGGKLDMGALMKEAMASPAIAEHKKDAPKYAQKLAKAAHSLSAEALGLDEFETLDTGEGCTCRRRWACRWRSTRRTRRERTPRARASRRNRGGRRYILNRTALLIPE